MSTVVPEPDKRSLDDSSVPQETNRLGKPDEVESPITIHVGAFAFLLTMWSLLWTAFRHPLTTTYVDVATGEVLSGYEEDI